MKRIVCLISLIVLSLSLSACAESKKEIAVLLYDSDDPFIANVGHYLEQYNESEYNLTIYDCKKSQSLQNEIAQQLYEDQVDLLIINPVERLSSYIFVEKSIQEDIPIIFFNREPLKKDLEAMERAYYVGANAIESGEMQADLIAEGFDLNNNNSLNQYDKNNDNIIQCVILKGEQGHQDAEERTIAVINELKEQGYFVEVLLIKTTDWNEDEAYRNMEVIMEDYGDKMELLISNNDAMAIGATKYLKDNNYYGPEVNGLVKDIPFLIVGIDGLSEAIELVEKGYMFGTILNDGDSMAKAIVELSQYILEKEEKMYNFELVDDKYIWISYKNFSVN